MCILKIIYGIIKAEFFFEKGRIQLKYLIKIYFKVILLAKYFYIYFFLKTKSKIKQKS